MPILTWPEWLPDQPAFQNQGAPVVRNCLPLTQRSYGPMPTYLPHTTNTLSERCQGSYSLKGPDGAVYLLAGDHQKLYLMPPATRAFTDVSRTTGGAYGTLSVAAGGHWSMTSFGSRVIATNGNDPMQTLMLPTAAGPHFTPLSATAPVAKFVTVVKDFFFTGNAIDGVDGPKPYRVWWSAINQPDYWPTPGSTEALATQSDYQDLQQTDLGEVTGLQSGFAPGSDVVIFCERGLYTASYVGPPLIFNFRVAQGSSGTVSPLSIVQDHARDNSGAIRPVVYYLSDSGFCAFDGSSSFPIGTQKFDKEFYKLLDDTYIKYVQGARDPRTRTIIWAFPTIGSAGLLSHMLVYNWELGRASLVELTPAVNHIEWFTTSMFAIAYDLDHIDQFGHLDIIGPSFDDPFWVGNATSRLAMFDKDHRLGIGGGPAMPVILETPEIQPADGRRAWVQLSRPLNDGGISTIAVGHRERQTDPVIWEPAFSVNAIGECPQRPTGRYLRFRMEVPAGQFFTQLQGLDIKLKPEARLR